MVDIPDYWKVSNYERARQEVLRTIDGMVGYQYGESYWNSLSLKERKNIIEDTIRDLNLGQNYRITEAEIDKIIKEEISKEG